ncbi:MAG: hypothetical protein KAY32_10485 [Candidatus Eisenbacteria sp.]|nr:hypothetical protein [Candidatus Eisenbacteria bacterium]
MQHLGRCAIVPLLAIMFAAFLAPRPAPAAVYNLHLYSDSNPDYTTRESYLQTVLPLWDNPQDQAIALWRWGVRNRRQTHATREDGRGIWDPILFFNSYANTFCGYVAGYQQSLIDGIGGDWRARYLELGGHSVYEVSWDAGATWHLFDASMNIFCFDSTGVVASAADVAAPHTSPLAEFLGETGPVAGHHYMYNFAPECGSNPVNPDQPESNYPWGYRVAADNPVLNTRTLRRGAEAYVDGFAVETYYTHVRHGWRYRLHLRRGEHYTRHWQHLGETIDYYRPSTYDIDPDDMTPAGDMRGNGHWVFTPGLQSVAYRLSMYDEQGTLHRSEDGGGGPGVHPAVAGEEASLTFKVYGANVITSGRVTLEGVRSSVADDLRLSVSRDAGLQWQEVWAADGIGTVCAEVALGAELLGGAWEYLVRFDMTAASDGRDCGLEAVTIETVTQVNRLALPGLQRGANRVRLYRGEQAESVVLWPALHQDGPVPRYQETADSWDNVSAHEEADAFLQAVLRPLQGGLSAHVTWHLTTPTDITRLEYGGSFLARASTVEDFVDLSHAFDGETFTVGGFFDHATSPTWDGRLYAEVTELPSGAGEVWLRYRFQSCHDSSYASTGVQDALMTVEYEPRDAVTQPVEVTYCWTEHRVDGNVERTHTFLAMAADEVWQINVGGMREPTMNWVRVNLEGYGPEGGAVQYGYSDGEDVGSTGGYDKRRIGFAWLDNLAYAAPYTVSRAGDPANPDDGGELTNGCLVPPTELGKYSNHVQEQSALWTGDEPVIVDVDLGQRRTFQAVRVTSHQPDGDYGHAGRIGVLGSDDGVDFTPLGEITHDDLWCPLGDWLGWESDRSSDLAALPAGGRLSFPFWLVLDTPATARFVRFCCEPLSGCGLGLSELQVFSEVTVSDWPEREIWMPEPSAGADYSVTSGASRDGRPDAGLVRLLSAAPNPFNARAQIAFTLQRAGVVTVKVFDVSGRCVRTLIDAEWRRGGVHAVAWDGRDDAARELASGVYACGVCGVGQGDIGRVVLVK